MKHATTPWPRLLTARLIFLPPPPYPTLLIGEGTSPSAVILRLGRKLFLAEPKQQITCLVIFNLPPRTGIAGTEELVPPLPRLARFVPAHDSDAVPPQKQNAEEECNLSEQRCPD